MNQARVLFIFTENTEQEVYPAKEEIVESCMNDFDINLIRRIRNGDIKSFEKLIEKYKDKAMTLSARILKNADDAEDATQEAFIKSFKAILEGQFEERSKFSTYFYRIVYNSALDYLKKHKAGKYDLLRIDLPAYSGESSSQETEISGFELSIDRSKHGFEEIFRIDRKAAEKEIQEIVNRYLAELPEKYSVILTLFYLNDLSHEEISKILRIPLGTVKNRIFRAKERLKEILLSVYPLEEILQYI